MMATSELVQQLQSTATDVARHLPEAHVLTRKYREPRFRDAVVLFLQLLDQVDVLRLTEKQLEETQHWTTVVQKAVELHMLFRFTERDTAECRDFSALVNRLRNASDALESGMPTDASKRPTDDQMLERFSAGLKRAKLA